VILLRGLAVVAVAVVAIVVVVVVVFVVVVGWFWRAPKSLKNLKTNDGSPRVPLLVAAGPSATVPGLRVRSLSDA